MTPFFKADFSVLLGWMSGIVDKGEAVLNVAPAYKPDCKNFLRDCIGKKG